MYIFFNHYIMIFFPFFIEIILFFFITILVCIYLFNIDLNINNDKFLIEFILLSNIKVTLKLLILLLFSILGLCIAVNSRDLMLLYIGIDWRLYLYIY